MRSCAWALMVPLLLGSLPAAAKPRPAPDPTQSATIVLPIAPGSYDQFAAKDYVVAGKYTVPAIPATEEYATGRQLACDMGFGAPRGGGESALIALFGALLKPLIGMVFGKADAALDRRIEAYKAEWSAGITTRLFASDAQGVVAPSVRCLRVVRLTERDDSDTDVAKIDFDALFLVHWLPGMQAWQLVPLRVFTDDPAARGERVKYAMALTGSATTIRDGNGELQPIVETVVLKGGYKVAADRDPTDGIAQTRYPVAVCDLFRASLAAITATSQSYARKTCGQTDAIAADAPVPNLPALAIPGTLPAGNAQSGSAVNLAFRTVEAGEGRRLGRLKDWKEYLGKAGDGISDALTTATTDLLSGDDE